MFYDIQFLNEILELLSMDCSSKVEIEESKDEDQDPEKKLGKPPLHELYPEIIKLIQDCLDLNTQSMAENRRRNEVKYMVGVTAIQLKEHIEKNLAKALESPFKISTSTIRRYMIPPHIGRVASKYYKSVIEGKVEKGENTLTFTHPDSHYCRAQVN